jgi:hypothetical protein
MAPAPPGSRGWDLGDRARFRFRFRFRARRANEVATVGPDSWATVIAWGDPSTSGFAFGYAVTSVRFAASLEMTRKGGDRSGSQWNGGLHEPPAWCLRLRSMGCAVTRHTSPRQEPVW